MTAANAELSAVSLDEIFEGVPWERYEGKRNGTSDDNGSALQRGEKEKKIATCFAPRLLTTLYRGSHARLPVRTCFLSFM